MVSVPITVLLYNGPLLCGFSVNLGMPRRDVTQYVWWLRRYTPCKTPPGYLRLGLEFRVKVRVRLVFGASYGGFSGGYLHQPLVWPRFYRVQSSPSFISAFSLQRIHCRVVLILMLCCHYSFRRCLSHWLSCHFLWSVINRLLRRQFV